MNVRRCLITFSFLFLGICSFAEPTEEHKPRRAFKKTATAATSPRRKSVYAPLKRCQAATIFQGVIPEFLFPLPHRNGTALAYIPETNLISVVNPYGQMDWYSLSSGQLENTYSIGLWVHTDYIHQYEIQKTNENSLTHSFLVQRSDELLIIQAESDIKGGLTRLSRVNTHNLGKNGNLAIWSMNRKEILRAFPGKLILSDVSDLSLPWQLNAFVASENPSEAKATLGISLSKNFVASVTPNQNVRVWTRTAPQTEIFDGIVPEAYEVTVSEEGQLYVGLFGGDVLVYDPTTGEELSRLTPQIQEKTIPKMILSPDQRRLAVLNGGSTDVYQIASPELAYKLIARYPTDQHTYLTKFSPMGDTLVSSTPNSKSIAVWQLPPSTP